MGGRVLGVTLTVFSVDFMIKRRRQFWLGMFGILVWGLLVVFHEFIPLLKEEVHVLGELG